MSQPRQSKLYTIEAGSVDIGEPGDWDSDDQKIQILYDHLDKHLRHQLLNGDVIEFEDVWTDHETHTSKFIFYNNGYIECEFNGNDTNDWIPEEIKINEFNRADFFEDAIGGHIWFDWTNQEILDTSSICSKYNQRNCQLITLKDGWFLITDLEANQYLQYPYMCDRDYMFNLPEEIDKSKTLYCLQEDIGY